MIFRETYLVAVTNPHFGHSAQCVFLFIMIVEKVDCTVHALSSTHDPIMIYLIFDLFASIRVFEMSLTPLRSF